MLGAIGIIALQCSVVYFLFGHAPKGIVSAQDEDDIRKEVMKKLELPDGIEENEAFLCGWVYVSSEYEEFPSLNQSVLLKMKEFGSRSRPRNVFFMVLKHNSLFLYEGEEQTSCVAVVVLGGGTCRVDLYPHTLLLDEIYRKENPLRLVSDGQPLFESRYAMFVYAANSCEKEDWLLGLRRATGQRIETHMKKKKIATDSRGEREEDPRVADAIFMERLNDHVRSPAIDEASQWLNAVLGRLFFNLFRSNDIERFLRTKFERRLSTTQLPFFVGEVKLREVSVGQSLPMFSNGKLHSVTKAGEMLASVDIMYPGGFKMVIDSEMRLQVHARMPPLVVPVVMTILVRRMEGRALLRIKAPPSDRLWIGFYQPPIIDMDLEPIINTRAITMSLVRTAFMRMLSEMMREFVVLPNMDDLVIPPLIIGDCYGGEKPFELDYLPPSIMSKARKHCEWTASSLSLMRKADEDEDIKGEEVKANSSESNSSPSWKDMRAEGSKEDLSMDPLPASPIPFRQEDEQNIPTYEEETTTDSNNSGDSNRPKEVFINVKRSVNTFLKARGININMPAALTNRMSGPNGEPSHEHNQVD